MQNYQHLNGEALLDLLARYTANYTKAYVEGGSTDELERLRKNVLLLQHELNFRKETFDASVVSNSYKKPGQETGRKQDE